MKFHYTKYSLYRGVAKFKTRAAIVLTVAGVVTGGTGLAFVELGTSHANPAPYTPPAPALYVTATGHDTGGCASLSQACATVNYALTQLDSTHKTIKVGAGTFDGFTVDGQDDGVTITGAGAGQTIVKPTTEIETHTAHKYTADMYASVFVNQSQNVDVSDMTISDNGMQTGSGGADAVVFWNASTGSLKNSTVVATYSPISGAQTGQGIALDASGSENASLDVNNVNISGFQKNGIDALNGNGATSGSTGGLTFSVEGGSITGAGATGTIAQNGIVAWNRGGGTVTGTVDGTKISKFSYTGSDYAAGILAYGGGQITPVKNTKFSQDQEYMASVAGSGTIDATVGNTFDFVSPATATPTQLGAIEDRLVDAMHAQDTPPHDNGAIYIKPHTAIVTPNTLGIQAAVGLVGADGTVYVAPGTYAGNVTINPPVTLLGANAGIDGASYLRVPETVIDGTVTINDPSVTLNGFMVDGQGTRPTGVQVNSTADNAVITDNIIKNIGAGYAQGVYVLNGADHVKVTHNAIHDITGTGQSAKAVYSGDSTATDPSNNLIVSNNTIYNVASDTKGAYGFLVNNGNGTTANAGLEVKSNTIRNLTTASGWIHAIGLEANTPGAVVNGNTIEGLVGTGEDKVGVWLEKENTSHASVKINQNNFLFANAAGIAVDPAFTSGTLDGTCNYWDSHSGPSGEGSGTGASVSSLVKYNPWLGSKNGDCNSGHSHSGNQASSNHPWYQVWNWHPSFHF